MKSMVLAVIAAIPLALFGASGATGSVAGAATTGLFIRTVAGGDGGPAQGVKVSVDPCAVSVSGRSAYVSGTGAVWRLTESDDWLTPFAGVGPGVAGSIANGASALAATVNTCGMAVDHYGNLLEAGGRLVRVVATSTGTFYGQGMIAGRIYTIAGGGTSTADGVPALHAALGDPTSVTADTAGNVVIADAKTGLIRVVALRSGSFYGKAMTAGDIYTVYDGGVSGSLGSVAADRWGNLIAVTAGTSRSSAGSVYVVAEATGTFYGQAMTAGHTYPILPLSGEETAMIALDGAGNVIVSDFSHVSGLGLVQVVAAKSGVFYGQSMTAGHVYDVAGGGFSTANGIPALQASVDPAGIGVDQWGNLLFADRGVTPRVRVVAVASGVFYGTAMTAGDIYTVAGNGLPTYNGSVAYYSGDGGPATHAQMHEPEGITADASGNILIADSRNGAIRVLAEATGTFYGQHMTKGDIYTISSLPAPSAVAVDAVGNVVIVSVSDYEVSVLATRSGSYYGMRMVAGHTYVLSSGGQPTAVAVDHSGNLVIGTAAYQYETTNYPGTLEVFAVKNGDFYGQQMVADRMYKVAGYANTAYCYQNLSGVPAPDAGICDVTGEAVDAAGNVVFSDVGNNMIRVLAVKTGTYYGMPMTAGHIYRIAGTGAAGASGNGGPAAKAELRHPGDVLVDGSGNLVIADSGNNEVRVVAVRSGTYYGMPMTAGDIYRIAGTGLARFGGNGSYASRAWIDDPQAVATWPGGGTLVTDDDRVRLISGQTTSAGHPR
jgi:hypothetical protein